MKSEKAIISAKDYGSNTELTDELTEPIQRRTDMNNNTPTQNNFQFNSRFVCDECARPLCFYGENFIETYTNGKVNILRCLCDIHADEMEVNAQ